MSKRTPKFDEIIDGTRVRVYATRSEFEVIFDDDAIDNPEAEVLCYPKVGLPSMWAKQGLGERKILHRRPAQEPGATEGVPSPIENQER